MQLTVLAFFRQFFCVPVDTLQMSFFMAILALSVSFILVFITCSYLHRGTFLYFCFLLWDENVCEPFLRRSRWQELGGGLHPSGLAQISDRPLLIASLTSVALHCSTNITVALYHNITMWQCLRTVHVSSNMWIKEETLFRASNTITGKINFLTSCQRNG